MISVENLPTLDQHERLALQMRSGIFNITHTLQTIAERGEKLAALIGIKNIYDEAYLIVALQKLSDAFESLKEADHAIELMTQKNFMS